MSESNHAFGQALVKSLVGERGHIPIARALPDLTLELAGYTIEGIPYSIYQLVKHMGFWQDFMLTHLEGGQPQRPTSVQESWPAEKAPAEESQLQEAIAHLLQGVDKAVAIAQSAKLDEPLAHFPGRPRAGCYAISPPITPTIWERLFCSAVCKVRGHRQGRVSCLKRIILEKSAMLGCRLFAMEAITFIDSS